MNFIPRGKNVIDGIYIAIGAWILETHDTLLKTSHVDYLTLLILSKFRIKRLNFKIYLDFYLNYNVNYVRRKFRIFRGNVTFFASWQKILSESGKTPIRKQFLIFFNFLTENKLKVNFLCFIIEVKVINFTNKGK